MQSAWSWVAHWAAGNTGPEGNRRWNRRAKYGSESRPQGGPRHPAIPGRAIRVLARDGSMASHGAPAPAHRSSAGLARALLRPAFGPEFIVSIYGVVAGGWRTVPVSEVKLVNRRNWPLPNCKLVGWIGLVRIRVVGRWVVR